MHNVTLRRLLRVALATSVVGALGVVLGSVAFAEGPVQGLATGETIFGVTLTDTQGMTLYTWDKDDPAMSRCYDACTRTWQPLIVNGTLLAPGADGTFGTTMRSDGTMQAMFNGQPLYRYQGDRAPGDLRGEGVGGVWWSVNGDALVRGGPSESD